MTGTPLQLQQSSKILQSAFVTHSGPPCALVPPAPLRPPPMPANAPPEPPPLVAPEAGPGGWLAMPPQPNVRAVGTRTQTANRAPGTRTDTLNTKAMSPFNCALATAARRSGSSAGCDPRPKSRTGESAPVVARTPGEAASSYQSQPVTRPAGNLPVPHHVAGEARKPPNRTVRGGGQQHVLLEDRCCLSHARFLACLRQL